MSDRPTANPERAVEILCREPLGAALWRASVTEALVEAYQHRVEELEQQKSPAAQSSTAPPVRGVTTTTTSTGAVAMNVTPKRPDDDPPAVGHVYPVTPDPKPQPLSGSRHAE